MYSNARNCTEDICDWFAKAYSFIRGERVMHAEHAIHSVTIKWMRLWKYVRRWCCELRIVFASALVIFGAILVLWCVWWCCDLLICGCYTKLVQWSLSENGSTNQRYVKTILSSNFLCKSFCLRFMRVLGNLCVCFCYR